MWVLAGAGVVVGAGEAGVVVGAGEAVKTPALTCPPRTRPAAGRAGGPLAWHQGGGQDVPCKLPGAVGQGGCEQTCCFSSCARLVWFEVVVKATCGCSCTSCVLLLACSHGIPGPPHRTLQVVREAAAADVALWDQYLLDRLTSLLIALNT